MILNRWDEFDDMWQKMIAESRQAWERFEHQRSRPLKMFHDEAKKEEAKENLIAKDDSLLEKETKNSLLDMEKTEDKHFGNSLRLARFPTLDKTFMRDDNVLKVKDDEKSFEITLDTSQYKPDELKVNVAPNALTVEAKHSEQSEDGHNFVSKQFLRRYTLPSGCKHELVSSNLSADGVLVITAPKSAIEQQEESRNVPILRA